MWRQGWICKLPLSFYLFAFIVVVLIISLVVKSMANYAEAGQCYWSGSKLTDEELRENMLRNLITAQVRAGEQENNGQKWVETFLIRRSLSGNDVIAAVKSKSVIGLPREAVYLLNTVQDVASVSSEFLRENFSIIQYGAGQVSIIPSQDIEATNTELAIKYLDEKHKHRFNLSFFERITGYGNHYFKVNIYSHIELACCEDIYGRYPKEGKDPDWYTRKNIAYVEAKGKFPHRYLVVSNCGSVLQRYAGGYKFFMF